MTSSDIRNKVKQFKKEYDIVDCTYSELCDITEKQGFVIVEYNHIINDTCVQALIDSLKLTEFIENSKGFTYADANHRIVFIHEDLSEKEKRLVLAHENGHIYLEHFSDLFILGKEIQEEYEANEFLHYLLENSVSEKFAKIVRRHKKACIAALLAMIVSAGVITAIALYKEEQKYYGEYYITDTGNKYHEKDCIFVKEKENVYRLTEEDFNSGKYSSCKTCLP